MLINLSLIFIEEILEQQFHFADIQTDFENADLESVSSFHHFNASICVLQIPITFTILIVRVLMYIKRINKTHGESDFGFAPFLSLLNQKWNILSPGTVHS